MSSERFAGDVIRLLLPVLASCACVVPLAAQQSFAIPQSPAFTYLDIAPSRIERPTTARQFGVGVLNGIGGEGRVLQGLALDAAPWSWIPGLSIPAERYDEPLRYSLANLSLSLGTARAPGDTASALAALGLRTTLLDRSDPLADAEFRRELRAVAVRCNTEDPDAEDEEIRACAAEGARRLRAEWLKTRWNRTSISVAVASGVQFVESRLGQREWTGISGWAAGAFPLTRHGQLLAQARVDHRAALDTLDALTAVRLGARALAGSASVNGFLELEWQSEPAPDAAAAALWSGGIEFRAAEDLWLATGFGQAWHPDEESRLVLIANLRWRVAEGPALGR